MIAEDEFGSVTTWLAECQRPLLVSHQRPDGDALGALAAMSLILHRHGAEPAVVLFAPLPDRYGFLRTDGQWHLWERDREALGARSDGVVILDTCALSQLEPIADFLAQAPRTLVIDHHATRDAIATRAGDLRLFDETASATSLIVAEWIESIGEALNALLATALFTGIATDCGWFRFANTDARTLRMAAQLVEAGADASGIYDALHQQDPPARLRLIARLLSSLELKAGGKLAVLYLRSADFAAAGADTSMTEDLINEATRLGSTEATLLFVEQPDHAVRVNFRSKRWLDVSKIAQRFGGGGHARAAGAHIHGTWNDVVPLVIRSVTEAL